MRASFRHCYPNGIVGSPDLNSRKWNAISMIAVSDSRLSKGIRIRGDTKSQNDFRC
jgi:hypothetical protein